MATMACRLRALVDGLNKRQAQRTFLPTGGDSRNSQEAAETGAAAQGLAMVRNKKGGPPKPLSLAELIARTRQV